jgi:hypothetical protein
VISPLKPCSVACPGWLLVHGKPQACPDCWAPEVLSPASDYYQQQLGANDNDHTRQPDTRASDGSGQ